ncbi:MAG: hypothetical protein FWD97_10170, partial [Defluviitaleaceae bacterium]|nr:hypothetical protein [Defluviitaleaceae bacterium]
MEKQQHKNTIASLTAMVFFHLVGAGIARPIYADDTAQIYSAIRHGTSNARPYQVMIMLISSRA